MKRLGIPAETPCAVQQWEGLIAVNYPARARGVTRHMRVRALPALPAPRPLAAAAAVRGLRAGPRRPLANDTAPIICPHDLPR